MSEFSWRRLAAAAIPLAHIAVTTGVWLLFVATLLVPAIHAAVGGTSAAILALSLVVMGLAIGATAPARWLRLRPSEQNGRIYARFGVRRFRAIALRGDFMTRVQRRIAGPLPAPALSSAGYPALARWTVRNERIHWAWVLATPALVVWGATHGRALTAALVLTAMVPLNLYPIALQRYTRGRLETARRSPQRTSHR